MSIKILYVVFIVSLEQYTLIPRRIILLYIHFFLLEQSL